MQVSLNPPWLHRRNGVWGLFQRAPDRLVPSYRQILYTVKILKFGTPQTIAIIVLKNRKVCGNIALMLPKDADGMANSVDPDQTASSEAV